MTAEEIYNNLKKEYSESIELNNEGLEPFIQVNSKVINKLAIQLRDDQNFQFDVLMCLSGVDYPEYLEVVYHLHSMKFNHKLTLKSKVSKNKAKIPSVAWVWRTADWHERETYDLFGIEFVDHPDLRRILLPEDWKGFPLRKDYVTPEFYQDIKIRDSE